MHFILEFKFQTGNNYPFANPHNYKVKHCGSVKRSIDIENAFHCPFSTKFDDLKIITESYFLQNFLFTMQYVLF